MAAADSYNPGFTQSVANDAAFRTQAATMGPYTSWSNGWGRK